MANNRLAPVTDFDISKFKKLDDEHHQGLFCHAIPKGVRLAIIATPTDWDAVLAQVQGARGDDVYGERAEFVQMVRAAQGLPAQARP